MPSQQILKVKANEVEKISHFLTRYKVIGIAGLQKVRASQLQELRKNLAGNVHMKVIKNTLMNIAIENCKEKQELKKLCEHLTEANVYLFTNLNPFTLSRMLEKSKVKTTAKAGDIASFDVIVPAGNTGQPPGPIISQLNAVGLPTRIEAGSVWISKDTLVVRKGEVIDEKLASVLSKLEIKPVEAGLTLKVIYDDGLIITQEQLHLDIEGSKQEIEKAHCDAFALSLSIAYPTKENAVILLQIAKREAYALSLNAAIPTKETIKDLIIKAHMQMLNLSSRLPTLEEKAISSEKP